MRKFFWITCIALLILVYLGIEIYLYFATGKQDFFEKIVFYGFSIAWSLSIFPCFFYSNVLLQNQDDFPIRESSPQLSIGVLWAFYFNNIGLIIFFPYWKDSLDNYAQSFYYSSFLIILQSSLLSLKALRVIITFACGSLNANSRIISTMKREQRLILISIIFSLCIGIPLALTKFFSWIDDSNFLSPAVIAKRFTLFVSIILYLFHLYFCLKRKYPLKFESAIFICLQMVQINIQGYLYYELGYELNIIDSTLLMRIIAYELVFLPLIFLCWECQFQTTYRILDRSINLYQYKLFIQVSPLCIEIFRSYLQEIDKELEKEASKISAQQSRPKVIQNDQEEEKQMLINPGQQSSIHKVNEEFKVRRSQSESQNQQIPLKIQIDQVEQKRIPRNPKQQSSISSQKSWSIKSQISSIFSESSRSSNFQESKTFHENIFVIYLQIFFYLEKSMTRVLENIQLCLDIIRQIEESNPANWNKKFKLILKQDFQTLFDREQFDERISDKNLQEMSKQNPIALLKLLMDKYQILENYLIEIYETRYKKTKSYQILKLKLDKNDDIWMKLVIMNLAEN